MIYGGSNSQREGHQFVFDGYKADRYHVNWGWGGTANGYYLLSTLEPDQQGIGGNSGGGFSIGQNAIVGIKKAETGSLAIVICWPFLKGVQVELLIADYLRQKQNSYLILSLM